MNENKSVNTQNETAVKLPMWRKIGYGLGESASGLSFTMIGSYLTVFYSDVVGLAPAVISIVMLVARIWQALCDPIFGSVAENTNTKWGRYRPYILFGAPLLAVFSALTFLNLDIPDSAKAFWCAITYLLSATIYSFANGAVGSIVNSLTSINAERVSANAVKGIVSSGSNMILSAVTMPLILFFGAGDAASSRGYFMTAVVFSICSLPLFLICFASTKEVIGGGNARAKGEKRPNPVIMIIKSFAGAVKDRNVAWLMTAMIVYLTGLFGRIGIMVYFFIYILKDPMGMAAFGTAMTGGMMVVNFYTPFLLNRIDKKIVGVIACILQAACCITFYFMGQAGVASIIVAVVGFIYGATNMVTMVSVSLVGELIDDNWLRTGVRSDGTIGAAIGFSTKIANAIGGSIGIVALGAVGFVANAEMAPEVLTRMNAVINFMPAAFFLLAIIPFMMIRMTNKKGRENEEKIKAMAASSNK